MNKISFEQSALENVKIREKNKLEEKKFKKKKKL